MKEYQYPRDTVPEFSSILIPTIDNTQIEFLLSHLTQSGRSVLLLGESGTAKTATINTFLKSLDNDKWVFKQFIVKTIGTTYGPTGGKRMEVFIDDISMPEINEWVIRSQTRSYVN